MASKIEIIWDEFVEAGVLEDRMEYTRDDLMSSHPDLTDREATDLYLWLQNRKELGGVELGNIPAETIKECLMEAIHGSWDGWADDAKPTLNYLMYDIMRYHRHSK